MTTNRFFTLPIALFSLATLSSIGVAAVPGTLTVARAVPAPGPEIVYAKWVDIEGLTYEMRGPFSTGVKRLEAKVDLQMAALATKRATMSRASETQDWDFAMKEMGNSRSYLRSMGEEMSTATPDTWRQQKDKVGNAWLRTQNAHHNVVRSTTG